ncbi:unnamed protein product [Phytophthora fragariaefolia]|uniref:Unnamed protein product n=1 Tax=Phytophthora fragariaefolia TaxID=1490495 RepID=A0A9W6X1J7_9STRA|nr:unnamed protein product [Phytophthora fragariaefolia]
MSLGEKVAALAALHAASAAAGAVAVGIKKQAKANTLTVTQIDFEDLHDDTGDAWFPANFCCSKIIFQRLVDLLASKRFAFRTISTRNHSYAKRIGGVLYLWASSGSWDIAVVQDAFETRLIQDDENCGSGEDTGVDADANVRHNGQVSDEENGGGDREGGEMVRASQIDCRPMLSANTVEALFGSDSENGDPPPLSQETVDSAFKRSQPGAAYTINTTEQTVVIGAFQ